VKFPKPTKRVKVRKRVRRVKRTKPGQPTLKRLDDLARSLVRARGRCEAVGWKLPFAEAPTPCKGVLQWAHIIGREHKRNNLRWRMDNAFCLCAGHHFRWTKKNLPEWHHFLRDRIGIEKWGNLEREALFGEKADRNAALAYLLDLVGQPQITMYEGWVPK
jgi:hypothetical protein